jgi:UDP:flavonoid glycosyltransferase YjiC (YdhE family)
VVRALEVSKRLREMGYRIVFGGGGRPLAAVQAAGFEVRPLPEFDIAWALARIWQGPAAVHTVELVEQFVTAEVALLRELRPDVVFQDGRLTASTSAGIAGLPLISLGNAYGTPYAVNGLLSFKSPGPPPVVGPGGETAYNVVRGRFGLPPVGSVLELMVGDLNLMCDAAEYAPVANAPASFHYVGPLIWNGPAAAPPWLAELDPARPTIYFTMGSTGPAEAFRRGGVPRRQRHRLPGSDRRRAAGRLALRAGSALERPPAGRAGPGRHRRCADGRRAPRRRGRGVRQSRVSCGRRPVQDDSCRLQRPADGRGVD